MNAGDGGDRNGVNQDHKSVGDDKDELRESIWQSRLSSLLDSNGGHCPVQILDHGQANPGFHLSPSLATVLFPVAFQIAPDLDLKGFSLHFKTWNNRGSGQIATFSGVFHSKKLLQLALLILGQIFCENTFQG
ncbi:hypothetical protein V6N13_074609 [Hibiscus sabdariffa]